MATRIGLGSDLYRQLGEHLAGSEVEEVGFLAAREDTGSGLWAFDLYAVPPQGFAIQTGFHVRLHEATRAEVVKWAHDRGAALVEAHAHRSPRPARFSPSDLHGLEDWVPHVRWRLRGRPYVALVFGDDSFDALAWTGSGPAPEAVAGLHVDGRLLTPTGLTYRDLTRPRWSRP